MDYGKNLDLEPIRYFCEFDNVGKTEEWRDVLGYEGHYQVSDLGRIKTLKCWHGEGHKILKQGEDSKRYRYFTLTLNGREKTGKTHKLVGIAFLNHTPCGYELVINHKNFIKTDNRKLNLEIVTHRENTNKKHIKSTSKYVGVCWNKNANKWQSEIRINGKAKYLGLFNSEVEASEAYLKALNK